MSKVIRLIVAVLMIVACITAGATADTQNVIIEAKNIQAAPTLDGIISEG